MYVQSLERLRISSDEIAHVSNMVQGRDLVKISVILAMSTFAMRQADMSTLIPTCQLLAKSFVFTTE